MRIYTIFEQVHILNNNWISEFWYGFIVLIGLVICIIYYVHHKKKEFRYSLLILLTLFLFSLGMHNSEKPTFENPLELNGLSLDDDNYGHAPDYLGSAIEKIFDYVKRKFID